MLELTQEQIKTLEDAFNSLPEKMRTGKYRTMEGIEQQLDSGSDRIFYSYRNETGGVTITFMKVGEETEESKEALNKVRENVLKYWKDLRKN